MQCDSDPPLSTTPLPPALVEDVDAILLSCDAHSEHQRSIPIPHRPPQPVHSMAFEHHSVLAMYKTGHSVRQVTVGYGSDNDVMLREELHINESCSCSESDTDGTRRGRIVYTNMTPPNMEGVRLPTPAGGREFEVDRPRYTKKAGVRRKRRWMNDYFIDEQYQKHLPKDVDEARKEWLRLYVPEYTSQFRDLFEDDDCMAAFDAFVDIGMDDEASALAALEGPSSRAAQQKGNRRGASSAGEAREPTAFDRYHELPRHMRSAVRQAAYVRSSIRDEGNLGCPTSRVQPSRASRRSAASRSDIGTVLEHVEDILLDLHSAAEVHGGDVELSVLLPDSFHRLVWHSVATFHDLTSFSRQNGNGQRTSFARPRREVARWREDGGEVDVAMLSSVMGRFGIDEETPGPISVRSNRGRLSNVVERLLAQKGGNWVSDFEAAAAAQGIQEPTRARQFRKTRPRQKRTRMNASA